MIGVKEAVAAATRAAEEFYEGKELEALALEEVELDDDDRYWQITLGFMVPKPVRSLDSFAKLLGEGLERKYKVFRIDSETGKVVSMKIREI